MPNQFATTSWVSMEILRILQNSLEVADNFNSEWESEFGKTFAVGSTVQIKLPQRFTIRNGLGYAAQGLNRLTTTVSLDQVFGIDFEWDSYERMVNMERSEEELKKQYLIPAATQLKQETDSRAAEFAYQNCSNVEGVLGTDATTLVTYLAAEMRLFQKACPVEDKKLILSPSAMAAYVGPNVTQFNPVSEITRMYKKGVLGTAAGWEWRRSNSLYSHTAGTWAGAVTVTGAGQSGSSLIITGGAGDTINKGDKISLALVYSVNPSTRRIAGAAKLQHFTVTQDFVLTGGADTISILPAMYGPGHQYQNVSVLPADSAPLTLWPGTAVPSGKVGTVSLGITDAAFAIAGGKLEVPKAVEKGEQTIDPDTGMAVRFVRAWDQNQSKMTNRFDMALGFGVLYQDNAAVAIAGA